MSKIDVFENLFQVIEDRKTKDPAESYVAKLMHRGTEKINSKILEEAEEVCEAATSEDKEHLIYEICDLLFHTFVLAGYKNISIEDLARELERRFGTSGLVEKERRNKS
jgi:phosphoribosyl-ATP pyrophosphohydrolase